MTNLRTLVNGVKTMRVLDSNMPIQIFHIFLYVALHEGSTVSDIAQALGMTTSSTSRGIRALSDNSWLRRKGLGLIRTDNDERDIRIKLVSLTPKGKATVTKLERGL